MHELALFAGAGGGILGGHLLGWRCVCAVECDAYARDVLVARQNDGCLPPFPIWDDVCTFDGRPWRGLVDVVSGGFPCQDISVAGKGAGLDGERSGLWGEMRRIIGEVRPRYVLVENSPALTLRGGVRVTADLAALGYVGRNGVLGAVDAGAPHKRERIWFLGMDSNALRAGRQECDAATKSNATGQYAGLFDENDVAHADSVRKQQPQRVLCNERRRIGDSRETISNAECHGWQELEPSESDRKGGEGAAGEIVPSTGGWWITEPDVGRVADGVAARVDRLRCLGNGQVPAVVRLAWETLQQGQRIRD